MCNFRALVTLEVRLLTIWSKSFLIFTISWMLKCDIQGFYSYSAMFFKDHIISLWRQSLIKLDYIIRLYNDNRSLHLNYSYTVSDLKYKSTIVCELPDKWRNALNKLPSLLMRHLSRLRNELENGKNISSLSNVCVMTKWMILFSRIMQIAQFTLIMRNLHEKYEYIEFIQMQITLICYITNSNSI